MNSHQFRNNFRRVKNAWIPRQAKSAGGRGPNATEAKYFREILSPLDSTRVAFKYQPDPIVITKTTKREYTADFVTQVPNGRATIHEVKGSYKLPTQDRARLAWEIAAEAHPEWDFVWAELTRKGWEIERWEDGGKRIFVHMATDSRGAFKSAPPDWRRHKPRKG